MMNPGAIMLSGYIQPWHETLLHLSNRVDSRLWAESPVLGTCVRLSYSQGVLFLARLR